MMSSGQSRGPKGHMMLRLLVFFEDSGPLHSALFRLGFPVKLI